MTTQSDLATRFVSDLGSIVPARRKDYFIEMATDVIGRGQEGIDPWALDLKDELLAGKLTEGKVDKAVDEAIKTLKERIKRGQIIAELVLEKLSEVKQEVERNKEINPELKQEIINTCSKVMALAVERKSVSKEMADDMSTIGTKLKKLTSTKAGKQLEPLYKDYNTTLKKIISEYKK